MAQQTSFTELDFTPVKNDLIKFLKSQEQFKDYDFAGTNMSILLDVLAYNTVLNNVYTNMAFSEMFLDSAQLRESLISHAKELNYLPSSKSGSTAHVLATINTGGDVPTTIIIPKYTEFTGRVNNRSYTFLNMESYSVKANASGVYSQEVILKEGKLVREFYEVGTADRFIISNEDVDISTIEVAVRDTSNINSIKTEFVRKNSIFGVEITDPVFYLMPYLDNKYEVTFGNNVFGLQPQAGNIVEVSYVVSTGPETNGITKFTKSSNISGYPVSLSLINKSYGGLNRETNDSIRFFAPKSIQIQERAVTPSDYEILLKSNFNEIQAVSVFGGEHDNPPQYGRVIVNIDTTGGFGLSDRLKDKYETFLLERSAIGIEPIIRPAKFMFVQVDSKVYFDVDSTSKGSAEVEERVRARINNFSVNNLSDFKRTFRYSKFVNFIDRTDPAILSNDTNVKAIIEMVPSTQNVNNIQFTFNNPVDDCLDGSNIVSSAFTFEGTNRVFFRDDGLGNIHISRVSSNATIDVKRNVGTIDYASGFISISSILISAYQGAAIRFYAIMTTNDIVPPPDRIIAIRQADTQVEAIASTV